MGMAATISFDADAFVLAFVADAYARADEYRLREPRIGVSAIVDHLRGHAYNGMELVGKPMVRREHYRLIYNACQRLVKAGKLEASEGVSSSGGVERQYNPKAVSHG